MIDPIAIGQTKEYVCEYEREKKTENPTVWLIGALDSITKSKIIISGMDVTVGEDGKPVVQRKTSEVSNDFTVIKYGLKGWKNFGALEFKMGKEKISGIEVDAVPDDLIKRIPLFIIHELAQEIWGENQADEVLEKN